MSIKNLFEQGYDGSKYFKLPCKHSLASSHIVNIECFVSSNVVTVVIPQFSFVVTEASQTSLSCPLETEEEIYNLISYSMFYSTFKLLDDKIAEMIVGPGFMGNVWSIIFMKNELGEPFPVGTTIASKNATVFQYINNKVE